MNKYFIWMLVGLVFSVSICNIHTGVYGQSQPKANAAESIGSGGSIVSVSASLTVQVSNETVKAKEGMLRSSVISFLNSGPNALKTSPNDQTLVNSKIANLVNNDTQNVQGIEATNAIIGVEISKALKTVLPSGSTPNVPGKVTILTSSTCKPSSANSISCDNAVTIK